MKVARSRAELLRRLAAGEIVPVKIERWEDFVGAFRIVETVTTALGSTILVARWEADGIVNWGMVEDAEDRRRVVRPLADEAAVRALIADRLAAYERMWDG